MKNDRYWILSLILCGLIGLPRLQWPTAGPHSNDTVYLDSLAQGKKLALVHCQRCHSFTDPSLLDKKTWQEGVLPNMAQRLGLQELYPLPAYRDTSAEDSLLNLWEIYPRTPQISLKDWNLIVHYYVRTAPVTLSTPTSSVPIRTDFDAFTAYQVSFPDKPFPRTTLLKFDPSSAHLFVGDAQPELLLLNGRFELVNRANIKSPASDIDFPRGSSPRLLMIGSIAPSDLSQGELLSLDGSPSALHFSQLARPVQFSEADLNSNGTADLIICEYGNHRGKLAWYENGDPLRGQILSTLPGYRKVEVKDVNGDKQPDLIALRAQAYEAITIFMNRGNGQFIEKTILQFPPVYGLSYFETADFNQDGHWDILLSNGDNWDYSPIVKPYHGIRLFLNDGKNAFSEAFFFPFYGCSKAIARDFDRDGRLDIAATSFYAELEQPEQSFVLLHQTGPLQFEAQFTPAAATGKWLNLESGDIDRDGDEDILLGSYFHTAAEISKLAARGISDFPQLLVLINQHAQK